MNNIYKNNNKNNIFLLFLCYVSYVNIFMLAFFYHYASYIIYHDGIA